MNKENKLKEYVQVPSNIKADFAYTYTGKAMRGTLIEDRDTVLIKADEEIKDGDIIAYSFSDGVYLGRIYSHPENNAILLTSDNIEYEPLYLSGKEIDYIHIIGKAVSIIREL